ncbi:MAG TPA: hypothetical protein VFV86_09770 [Nitrososphaeraceae archaeon]|nr:hypothetical protein [Nitrososphaeraceae archaeon]
MKTIFNSTVIVVVVVVVMIFVFSIRAVHPVYGQETTANDIKNIIQKTAEKIKNMASEVSNNTTGIISPTEGQHILNQLGEAVKKTAIGGADVLSNISGEIKEGFR